MAELKELVNKERVRQRVCELAEEISRHYQGAGEPVVAICVLKGAFIFFADLVRRLSIHPELDFVRLASYGQDKSPGEKVLFSKDIETSVTGKHVLLVEDIVDTGRTMHYLTRVLQARGPRSVRICSLVHKQSRAEIVIPVDFCGFSLEKGFVVGYGLDYAEQYRQLDGIFELV
ncbi:MAG: hypoxanthine phosphoribosyltransferase [Thermodesulfobacteriota bacterium]